MARISIDDELHADHRFKRLVRKLGDEDKAVGLLYRFWRIAQDYWGDEMSLIPTGIFEAEEFQILNEVGLAEKEVDGFYASGSEERFGWYLQRCRASKAGVEARRRKLDAEQPEQLSRSTETSAPVNPSLRTAPLRSDIAPIKEKRGVTPADAAEPTPGVLVWRAYSEGYRAKYGELPSANAKQYSICKQITQRIPANEAPEVAQFYLDLTGFYATRGHPLGLLLQDCEKIRTEWKTGRVIKPAKTFADLKSEANRELYQQVCEGKV